jgi:hypothetical protein
MYLYVRGKSNMALIATELKTDASFTNASPFYQKSRGVQLYGALYAYRCPTFLLTAGKWKLFYLNSSQNGICTYPCEDIAKSASELDRIVATMSMRYLNPHEESEKQKRYVEFITVLGLCPLSRYTGGVIPGAPSPSGPISEKPVTPSSMRKLEGKQTQGDTPTPSIGRSTRYQTRSSGKRDGDVVGQFMANDCPLEYRDVWVMDLPTSDGESDGESEESDEELIEAEEIVPLPA